MIYIFDIIGELHKKIESLNRRKNILARQYEEQITKINEEIDKYNMSIQIVNEAIKPYLCKNCNGSGEERFTDGAGSRDTRKCEVCGGTGIIASLTTDKKGKYEGVVCVKP